MFEIDRVEIDLLNEVTIERDRAGNLHIRVCGEDGFAQAEAQVTPSDLQAIRDMIGRVLRAEPQENE